MITVVTFLWQTPGYRSQYEPAHVNALARMVRKHYAHQHHFVCVTNVPGLYAPNIETIPDREDWSYVPSPHGGHNPSCYRRLRLFGPDAGRFFGSKYVCLDLDTVILGDITPLWNRTEPFVIWRDPFHHDGYCASMMLLKAGARPLVWSAFKPSVSPQQALAAGCRGSDQGWIRHVCGPSEATWTKADGVYSYRADLQGLDPPEDARIVMFHGRFDPWGPQAQAHAWVREHYPLT